jgi:1-deoxy-D-xylulose-5-phosphate synthase
MKIPVVVGIDRAGLVGGDGCTHQGIYDIAILRPLPGIVIMAPKDENELQHMVYSGIQMRKTVFIRYPKEPGIGVEMDSDFKAIPLGKSEILREGKDAVVLALGPLVYNALEAAEKLAKDEKIDLTVINVRFVKPLDRELIVNYVKKTRKIITIEDGIKKGGFRTLIREVLVAENIKRYSILSLGVPDEIIEVASRNELLQQYNLDSDGIRSEIGKFLKKNLFTRILKTS